MDSTQTGQPSPSPTPPRLEDLARRTARRLLLPYIIGYASSAAPSDQPREVAVIVNPRTGSLTMIDGGIDGPPFSRGKEGLVPASKESIESMPTVKVAEQGFDCAICLSEFEIGEEAKQMPCNHKYHAACIDKWLGIQGSCPVCRHRMPVEGEREMNKEGGGDDGDREEADDESAEDEEEGGEEEEGEDDAAEEGEVDLGFLSRIPTFVFHIYFAGRNRPSTDSEAESQSHEAGESEEESGEANESEGSDSEEESDGSSSSDMEVDDGGSTSPEMPMDID